MKEQYKIGIIIVTQNGKKYLENLLPSILTQDIIVRYKILVIDNNSSDGTKELLLKYPEIDYLFLSKNKGFAEPNNIGIRYFFTEYLNIDKIVFLNNDTVVTKTFLSTLFSGFFEKNIATVQTKIVSFKNREIIDSVGIMVDDSMSAINKGQGEKDIGQYNTVCEIFGTTGSAMMVSRYALEAIDFGHGNYFDPVYFAYQEDVDISWRLRLSGFVSYYVPGEPVLHVHSATGKNYSFFKSLHIHRNTLFTIIKNIPFPLFFLTIGSFCLRYIYLISSISKKRGASFEVSKNVGIFGMIWIVVLSWLSLIWYLPNLIKKRIFIQNRQKISLNEVKKIFNKFKANKQKIIYGTRT